jgi:hypothetical protein
MKHAGKNQLGAEFAEETKQRESGSAHTWRTERVHRHPPGEGRGGMFGDANGLGDECEVQFIFLRREAASEQCGDLLCASATEMGN